MTCVVGKQRAILDWPENRHCKLKPSSQTWCLGLIPLFFLYVWELKPSSQTWCLGLIPFSSMSRVNNNSDQHIRLATLLRLINWLSNNSSACTALPMYNLAQWLHRKYKSKEKALLVVLEAYKHWQILCKSICRVMAGWVWNSKGVQNLIWLTSDSHPEKNTNACTHT